MKKRLIIGGVLLVLILIVAFNYNAVPDDIDRATVTDVSEDSNSMNQENNSREDADINSNSVKIKNPELVFTGFGPAGKIEVVNFTDIKYSDISVNAEGVPTNASVDVNLKSVTSGKPGLDSHLCNEDFFECETYPNAVFELTDVTMVSESEYSVIGRLTFKDTTKNINFDIAKLPNENKYTSEFLLDVRDFGVSYTGINDEVQVNISFEI